MIGRPLGSIGVTHLARKPLGAYSLQLGHSTWKGSFAPPFLQSNSFAASGKPARLVPSRVSRRRRSPLISNCRVMSSARLFGMAQRSRDQKQWRRNSRARFRSSCITVLRTRDRLSLNHIEYPLAHFENNG